MGESIDDTVKGRESLDEAIEKRRESLAKHRESDYDGCMHQDPDHPDGDIFIGPINPGPAVRIGLVNKPLGEKYFTRISNYFRNLFS